MMTRAVLIADALIAGDHTDAQLTDSLLRYRQLRAAFLNAQGLQLVKALGPAMAREKADGPDADAPHAGVLLRALELAAQQ
jgi:hypothetical protein